MATTNDTGIDPKKLYADYLKSSCKDKPGIEDLIEAVMQLQNQVAGLGDLDGFSDTLEALKEICDKLLALPDYSAQFETLAGELTNTVTALTELCEKVETGNEATIAQLTASVAATEAVKECIDRLRETNTTENTAITDAIDLLITRAEGQIAAQSIANTALAAILASLVDDIDAVKTVYKLEGRNGVNAKRWDANSAPHGPTSGIFDCGKHINGAEDQNAIINSLSSLNDTFFGAAAGDPTSQEFYETWVYFPRAVKLSERNGNSGEYLTIKAASCNGKPVTVAESDGQTTGGVGNDSLGEFGTFGPGIVRLQMEISDFSAVGGFNILESFDGGLSESIIPPERIFNSMPTWDCRCITIKDGVATDLLTGDPFTFDPLTCSWCKPDCPDMPEPEAAPALQRFITEGCNDVDGDPANYEPITRVTTFADGVPTVAYFSDFGLPTQADVTNPNFVDCATGLPIADEPAPPPSCESWVVGNAYDVVGQNGVTVRHWRGADAVAAGNVDASAVFDFDNLLDDGPAHPNAPTTTTIQGNLLVYDNVNDQSQTAFCTYLYLTEETTIEDNLGRAEAVGYFIGECCGPLRLYEEAPYPNTTPSGRITLQPGIHKLAGVIHDLSAFSGVAFRKVNDDGSYTNIPESQLFTKKPKVEPCLIKICAETGVCADIKTGAIRTSVSLCKPSLCPPVGAADVDEDVQCAPKTLYRIEKQLGALERKWTLGDAIQGLPSSAGILDAFTATDAEGYPAHANAPTSTTVITRAQTTNVTDAGGEADQAITDGWLCIPRPVQLRELAGSAETVQVWMGAECGSNQMNMVLDAPYINTGPNPIGSYGPGVYRFRLYHHDFSANGTANLQYQRDNGTWASIPEAWISQNKPTVKCIDGWRCCDGKVYNADKSQEINAIDPADATDYSTDVFSSNPGCPGDNPC